MKSVEKCKRHSAFYPEKPQLHRSLAFVYSLHLPKMAATRDPKAKSSMYICLYLTPLIEHLEWLRFYDADACCDVIIKNKISVIVTMTTSKTTLSVYSKVSKNR